MEEVEVKDVGHRHFKAYMEFYKEELQLYEGLIRTYSITSTVISLKSIDKNIKIGRKHNQFGVMTNDFAIYLPIDLLSEIGLGKLFRTLNTCGWFVSTVVLFRNKQPVYKITKDILVEKIILVCKEYGANRIVIYAEAKYDIEVERELLPHQLYHIAPKIYEDKIKTKGLIPKALSKSAAHPDRVYLAKNEKDARTVLYNDLKNNASSSKHKTILWVIVTINLSKISEVAKFYKDPNYEYGVYTLSNIQRQAVEKIEDLPN